MKTFIAVTLGVIVGITILFVGCGAIVAGSVATDLPTTPPAINVDAAPVDDGSIGDGTWVVGTDIEPGTYRSTGAEDLNCYWARLSGTTGEFDDIIANDNTEGPTLVTIDDSDVAFESNGCENWVRQ